ncbi:MAG: hypothetical protein IRY86_08740 [Thermorudis peleae]|nr:hypothetical protein [Thermorudis peleae]
MPTDTVERLIAVLEQHGFRRGYGSSALVSLVHPDLPGLEVWIGTRDIRAERDGRELYRAALDRFDLTTFFRHIGLKQRG